MSTTLSLVDSPGITSPAPPPCPPPARRSSYAGRRQTRACAPTPRLPALGRRGVGQPLRGCWQSCEGCALPTARCGGGQTDQIGRASCRGRVCQYVAISVAAVSLKKKKNN